MTNLSNTLVISTYNWPEALELVLKSVKAQTLLPDEIIIADDGSTPTTKTIIDTFTGEVDFPVIHVWQEDQGFRKAKILNKAIAKAKGSYIIQVDGDCIMHHRFIEDHLGFAKRDRYLFGSRVNIQESYLELLFNRKQIDFTAFSKGINKRTRALHVPLLSHFYKESFVFSTKYRGCNASFFKSDFIAVNGYNEDFEGWGREDSELALRFHNINLMARRLRYRAIVFHVYHNEKSRDRLDQNDSIEHGTIKNKVDWTINGVDKYL